MTDETSPTTGMLTVIDRYARDPSVDVEKLERMMALHERLLERQAREAFAAAYVEMKPALPLIIRSKDNTQTNSRYAPLEDINKVVDPILQQYGFGTATKVTSQDEHGVTVEAELWHAAGHVERTQVTVPLDLTGIKGTVNKTAPHAVASSITYGKRIAVCALLNISTGDDHDGNLPNVPIDAAQAKTIRDLMIGAGVSEARVLKYAKAESMETIPQREFKKVVTALEQIEAANAKEKAKEKA